jgi:hypothetical protein
VDLLAVPVFAVLCVLVDLVFCVFAVLVVESFAPAPLANAGIVNPTTMSDANIRLSSFFMFLLLLLEFTVRPHKGKARAKPLNLPTFCSTESFSVNWKPSRHAAAAPGPRAQPRSSHELVYSDTNWNKILGGTP